jgi:hypothetical protein
MAGDQDIISCSTQNLHLLDLAMACGQDRISYSNQNLDRLDWIFSVTAIWQPLWTRLVVGRTQVILHNPYHLFFSNWLCHLFFANCSSCWTYVFGSWSSSPHSRPSHWRSKSSSRPIPTMCVRSYVWQQLSRWQGGGSAGLEKTMRLLSRGK